jgi:hypothetical protein
MLRRHVPRRFRGLDTVWFSLVFVLGLACCADAPPSTGYQPTRNDAEGKGWRDLFRRCMAVPGCRDQLKDERALAELEGRAPRTVTVARKYFDDALNHRNEGPVADDRFDVDVGFARSDTPEGAALAREVLDRIVDDPDFHVTALAAKRLAKEFGTDDLRQARDMASDASDAARGALPARGALGPVRGAFYARPIHDRMVSLAPGLGIAPRREALAMRLSQLDSVERGKWLDFLGDPTTREHLGVSLSAELTELLLALDRDSALGRDIRMDRRVEALIRDPHLGKVR